jgi:hypothetical protein
LPPFNDWNKSPDASNLQTSAGIFGANQTLGGPAPSLDDTEASRLAPNFDLTDASEVKGGSPRLGAGPVDPFSRDVQVEILFFFICSVLLPNFSNFI